jgi:CBS domain-containing protein
MVSSSGGVDPWMDPAPPDEVEHVDGEEGDHAQQGGAAQVERLVVPGDADVQAGELAERHVRRDDPQEGELDGDRQVSHAALRQQRRDQREPHRGEAEDAVERIATGDVRDACESTIGAGPHHEARGRGARRSIATGTARARAEGMTTSMTIREVMRPCPVALSPRHTLAEAHGMMRAHTIRHLPVEEAGRLVGVVSALSRSRTP